MSQLSRNQVAIAEILLRKYLERAGKPLIVDGETWTRLRRSGCDMTLASTQEREMLGLPPMTDWRQQYLRQMA